MKIAIRILHCGESLENYYICLDQNIAGFTKRVADEGDFIYFAVKVDGISWCGARGIAKYKTDERPWPDHERYVQAFNMTDMEYCEPFDISELKQVNKAWHLKYLQGSKPIKDQEAIKILENRFEENKQDTIFRFHNSTYKSYEQEKLFEDQVNENTEDLQLSENELIQHIHRFIRSTGFYFTESDIMNFFFSLKTKPFTILSGISGTGKTKFVELFANSIGANEENGQFSLIPVRPDWSDSSDLLGYVDIKGTFQRGPLTKVIENAHENQNKPFFVVLDEMNLARVEYYFSDFLSVIESRKWKDGEIKTSVILPEEQVGKRLTIPSNLYIVGTVNMDETTHPFSKKVLDRANTIEFQNINLNHFEFFDSHNRTESIQLKNVRLVPEYLHLKDAFSHHEQLIRQVTEELVSFNEILQPIHAHIGYRVRDEICFYIIYSRYSLNFDDSLDFQISQKILPRLTASHGQAFDVLKNIFAYCTGYEYEEGIGKEQSDSIIKSARFPKSALKVMEMLQRGEEDGFTSFWMG